MYARAAAYLAIDNAHCDGMLTKHGIGRDWAAVEPKDDAVGYTPDIAGQYSWYYQDVFEYVDKLHAIAPIRTFTRADMALGDWELQGKWRLGSAAGHSQFKALHFYDGRPGLYNGVNKGAGNNWGKATSVATDLGPNLQFWVWRMGAAVGETDSAYFSIVFKPTDGSIQYAFVFPGQQAAGKYHQDYTTVTDGQINAPFVMAKPATEPNWSVVDRRDQGCSPTVGHIGQSTSLQIIRIEYDAGFALIRTGERDKGWLVGGDWYTSAGQKQTFALTPGQVEIHIIGHTAMFSKASLTAPTGKVLYPHKYLLVTSDYNLTPSYNLIPKNADQPAGTSLAVTPTYDGEYKAKPAIAFTTNGGARPVFYCAQEYRAATIDGAVTNPFYTNSGAVGPPAVDKNTFRLLSCSGQVGARWRGSTMTSHHQALPGYTLNTVKPNSKVRAYVNTEGSDIVQFTGYVTPPQKTMAPGARRSAGADIAKTFATLEATDIIEARLGRKQLDFHCSYEGWTEGAAFSHILNRAGVPSALISVNAACVSELPSGKTTKGTRKFRFSPDCEVVSALDTISKAYARRWGVDQNGVVFLAPAYTWTTGGTPDHVLDYDTTTGADIMSEFRSTRTLSEFRNWLTVMVGEGVDAAVKIIVDTSSMWTDTAVNFVGDVWQRFVSFPDGADANAIATTLWDEIARWHHYIEWTMHDRPTIMPDQSVQVQVPPDIILNNAIFRVLSKSWECNQDSGRFSQTIQAVMVEAGS